MNGACVCALYHKDALHKQQPGQTSIKSAVSSQFYLQQSGYSCLCPLPSLPNSSDTQIPNVLPSDLGTAPTSAAHPVLETGDLSSAVNISTASMSLGHGFMWDEQWGHWLYLFCFQSHPLQVARNLAESPKRTAVHGAHICLQTHWCSEASQLWGLANSLLDFAKSLPFKANKSHPVTSLVSCNV